MRLRLKLTDAIVERAAEAHYDTQGNDTQCVHYGVPFFSKEDPVTRAMCMRHMRAALEAIWPQITGEEPR